MILNHQHMLGKVFITNKPKNTHQVSEFLVELVTKIDMKVLMGPYTVDCKTLGNEGITGIILLETSHASCHFWTEIDEPFFNFDIYSCKEFSPEVVISHIEEYFGVKTIAWNMIDRN